ncbi:unnamed protein product [Schistosoma rodhaini]|uniref:DH domain-containing protein n=1 Tax=Schistosoma rodhaini TaxID=6188 RepID=A0AA85F883_9TREM|nr:unnamed protein product [Schistosoma rodhaini]
MTVNITYQLVWTELLDTENKYINLLQDVYDKVMLNQELDFKKSVGITQIPLTQLKQKLLGNWFELLSFHKIHVLPTLKECNGSAKMIKYWASIMAPCFIDLYTTYCLFHEKTKRLCAYLGNVSCKSMVLKKPNEKIGNYNTDTELFKSQLTKPVRRIQSYHVLLNKLQKEANLSDVKYLDDARQTFNRICDTVNVTMNLRGLTVAPSKLGHFLLEADFTVNRTIKSTKSKRHFHVILFTEMLLLTKYRVSFKTSITNNKGSEDQFPDLDDYLAFFDFSHNSKLSCNKSYEVEEEICLHRIGLFSNSHDRCFSLFTENYGSTYTFRSNDNTVKQLWTSTINKLLMNQLYNLRVDTNPQLQTLKRLPISSSHFSWLNSNLPVNPKTKQFEEK